MQDGKIDIKFGGWSLVLTALLCILKLTGVISISWWWCFCLIWLPFALLLGIIALIVILAFMYALASVILDLLKTKTKRI